MGEKNSVFVFKGPSHDEIRDALCSAIRSMGGRCSWDEHPEPMKSNLLTTHNGDVHAAYIHWNDHEIAIAVGTSLGIPWISVRIQEGSLWDYSLYLASENLNNFSTMPEYWDDDPEFLASWRGNSTVLVQAWGIGVEKVEAYLRPWCRGRDEDGHIIWPSSSMGKAYPDDHHEYGDIWQSTDFLRALGAHDPNWDQPHCIARLLERPQDRPWWKTW